MFTPRTSALAPFLATMATRGAFVRRVRERERARALARASLAALDRARVDARERERNLAAIQVAGVSGDAFKAARDAATILDHLDTIQAPPVGSDPTGAARACIELGARTVLHSWIADLSETAGIGEAGLTIREIRARALPVAVCRDPSVSRTTWAPGMGGVETVNTAPGAQAAAKAQAFYTARRVASPAQMLDAGRTGSAHVAGGHTPEANDAPPIYARGGIPTPGSKTSRRRGRTWERAHVAESAILRAASVNLARARETARIGREIDRARKAMDGSRGKAKRILRARLYNLSLELEQTRNL